MRTPRNIRLIWATCLLLAALNHARMLYEHGLSWDYGGVGAASAFYWLSLTLIDPIVAALLPVRPRIGVPATVILISTNVAHNLVVTASFVPRDALPGAILSSPTVLAQIGFLIFVAATTRRACADLARSEGRSRPA